MLSQPVKFYHRLPVFARSVVASARGLQLRRWRYGRETQALELAAGERETWPFDRLREWQNARLAEILERARHHVPYYREQWRYRIGTEDYRSLRNWPVLSKAAVRARTDGFVADDAVTVFQPSETVVTANVR